MSMHVNCLATLPITDNNNNIIIIEHLDLTQCMINLNSLESAHDHDRNMLYIARYISAWLLKYGIILHLAINGTNLTGEGLF